MSLTIDNRDKIIPIITWEAVGTVSDAQLAYMLNQLMMLDKKEITAIIHEEQERRMNSRPDYRFNRIENQNRLHGRHL